ncbi:MAG: Gfo/Idh/MocA family oxidoreductase [Candidatus Aminicenantes bacterium]|nr:Gfo/Idh/MocA family oxidoreductase [Candidatus Aminicenantes bacterium]
MSEIPKVGWGIIGAGDIAHRVMAPAMRECPHSELAAVTRTTLQGAREFARMHGARRGYDKLEDLLGDSEVEAVYVATPVARHLPDTLAAAAAGRHVLCEKPLALNVAEGEEMEEACRRAGITFMTCYYQRFNARHRKLKELLEVGAIGQVTSARVNFSGRSPVNPKAWRQNPALGGGGPYMDNASHAVDLLRFFLGDVVEVAAFTDVLSGDYAVEDTASSLLRMTNGAQAVVTAHWSSGDPDEDRNSMIEIVGTEGILQSSPLHEKFSRGRLLLATRQGEERFEFEESTHVQVLTEFAAALAEGRDPAITIQDGVAAQRVVESVYASSRSGRAIRLN